MFLLFLCVLGCVPKFIGLFRASLTPECGLGSTHGVEIIDRNKNAQLLSCMYYADRTNSNNHAARVKACFKPFNITHISNAPM